MKDMSSLLEPEELFSRNDITELEKSLIAMRAKKLYYILKYHNKLNEYEEYFTKILNIIKL